jgi:hypothetical protein
MKISLTKEQIEDIQKREKDALEYLKKNQLNPSAQVSFEPLGNDVFGIKVTPFLQDNKHIKEL